jgi:hypothetical protein
MFVHTHVISTAELSLWTFFRRRVVWKKDRQAHLQVLNKAIGPKADPSWKGICLLDGTFFYLDFGLRHAE